MIMNRQRVDDQTVTLALCDRWRAIGVRESLSRQHQTVFGNLKWNCFAACVASLLLVPLKDVPNFCALGETAWWVALREWLAAFDVAPMMLGITAEELSAVRSDATHWLRGIPAIAGGKSPRGDFLHAVLVLDGVVIHDPHPDGTGLSDFRDVVVFVSTKPESITRNSRGHQ